MPISGPTVVRRQLGRRLRRLRDMAGKSERDVEEANLASRAKLWRIESGKTSIRVADVRSLCWLYGADAETTEALVALAVATTGHGWVEDYEGLPDWFGLYVGLEAAASEVRTYDPELVHGLLQTPDYTRALFREANPDISSEVVERQVKLRAERQQTLINRTPPMHLTAILGASPLTRMVGGRRVTSEQIRHLKELDARDHICIRILPARSGGHAAMHVGAFAILDFADPDDPSIVYLENATGARYLEKDEELAEYRRIFDLVYRKTIPIGEYQQ